MEVLNGKGSIRIGYWMALTYLDAHTATPDLQTSNDLNEFLTSPLLDSPMDDELLATPAIGSADMGAEILTSPLLEDYSGDSLEFPPLFDDFSQTIYQQPKPQQELTALPEFDIMYKISPTTPFIDSPSSPFENGTHMPSSSRRKTNATGTRKNVTPESLVPIDAPTQPRKYLTPSATSRKTVPAVWQRKRSRRSAFGDEEEDELGEEQRPSLSEQEAIEAKRRQNTIAARRSRKRKLEYQRELEESVEQYKQESEAWKMRAQTYFALLRSHQIPVPDLGPDP
ncbi:hypothetical protein ID866_8860 [Astraeus odoratus]|nr:hypothetical protein ID866_8860 [Astraeus odoratus]